MDDFKGKISKEVLDSLKMEDLWKSPGLSKYVKEKYPLAYYRITKPYREFGLYGFLKIAKEQKEFFKKAIDMGPNKHSTKRDLDYCIEVIRQNKLDKDAELWHGGIPFKFELSRFVDHYASERTYSEWRNILKDLGTPKSNMERILKGKRKQFKESD